MLGGLGALLLLALCLAASGCVPTSNGSDDADAERPADGGDADASARGDSGPDPSDATLSDAGPPDAGSADAHPGLTDPALARERAPETYAVYVETTAGDVVIDVTRAWSPNGADRFYNLVRIGYLDDCAFFRVLDGFVAQTGLHGDPGIAAVWQAETIPADPVIESNLRGTVTYATAGGDPGSRTTQFFVNYGGNSFLDGQGFTPFGVVRDMTPIDGLYADYGDGPPGGPGPDQARLRDEGNAYLRANFPELDYIVSARVID